MGRAQDEQRADRARHHALIVGPDRREHAVHMREPGGRGDGEANDEVIEKAQTHSVAPRAPISAQTLCTELRYWVVRRENSGSSWGPGLDALAAPAAMIQNRPARRLLPTPMSKLRGVAPLIPRAVARHRRGSSSRRSCRRCRSRWSFRKSASRPALARSTRSPPLSDRDRADRQVILLDGRDAVSGEPHGFRAGRREAGGQVVGSRPARPLPFDEIYAAPWPGT